MPIVSGIVYCSVISACSSVYALRRVEEWTVALKAWCDRQPELVPFSGKCMIHRAEIMLLQGTWTEALEEARHAEDRCDRGDEPDGVAHACYTQGQLHRLRGDFAGAEEAYRRAALLGRDPQPGLALLRLAHAWAAGHGVAAYDLLSEPWTAASLRPFFGRMAVADWFNPTAPAVKDGRVVPADLDEAAALQLMLADPLLIRRPLMQVGVQRMAGFDAERVDAWIGLTTLPGREIEACPRPASPCGPRGE